MRLLVILFWAVMLGRVIVSWVDPGTHTRPARFLYGATEPILAPVRRALPRTGVLDFSPLVVMLALTVLLRLVAL